MSWSFYCFSPYICDICFLSMCIFGYCLTKYFRLGRTADARKQIGMGGLQPDIVELHKLEAVDKHLGRFADARKIGNWKSALRECNAAIAAGADSCAMVKYPPFYLLLPSHALLEECYLYIVPTAALCF